MLSNHDQEVKVKKLSDFKPLKRVVLPGLGDLGCSGLVLIVGPNSSGKSQLLQDLFQRLSGAPRQLVVAEEVQIEKPPLEPFLRCLEDEGYFEAVMDDAGNKHLRPQTMHLGSGQPLSQLQPNQAQQWYGVFTPEAPHFHKHQNEFLNYFGRLLVTALFLDRRLTSLNSAGVIDFLASPPQHDLHALYIDDRAKSLLYNEALTSFGRAVWPDMSAGSRMVLKVSDEGVRPTAEDRLSHRTMAEYRSLETEGDGLKSYLATCVSLLLGRRPVCLIDEPELCLNPPQAYNLGRFIGRFGAGVDTVTLAATHSSHLLRGVLQSTKEVQIVRLSRRGKAFVAHHVSAHVLSEALSRPTLRAEAVLDGIFAQGVVIVEADGDRLVYQTAWEAVNQDVRLDLHFTAVGGSGGIADTCSLYRTLRIPVAVIADLDVIIDNDRVSRVLGALLDDVAERVSLLARCRELASALQALPPTRSPEDVGARLRALEESGRDWARDDDVRLRRELRSLANDLDRMRRLKRGGIDAFEPPLRQEIAALVQCLARHGLFVVPVGELEQWLAEYPVGVSKSDKRAWSTAAAEQIEKLGRQVGDIWGFIDSVGTFVASLPAHISSREGTNDQLGRGSPS